MPVTPTYPGVYIEEIPSGVRTITGVATSIALFIGRTRQGPLNRPVRCLNYSDFARAFSADSRYGDLPRSVRLFFENGGTQCYVVRIAQGATRSSVTLQSESGTGVLTLTAKNAGVVGETIRAAVTYNGPQPEVTFNLELFRWETDARGQLVKQDREVWSNLSMDPNSSRYAPDLLTQNSQLVDAALAGGAPAAGTAFSQSGRPVPYDSATPTTFRTAWVGRLGNTVTTNRFQISVEGAPFAEVNLGAIDVGAIPAGSLNAVRGGLATAIQTTINAALPLGTTVQVTFENGPTPPAADGNATALLRISSANGDVFIQPAQDATADLAVPLMLGTAQGGLEVSRYSARRPAPTGITFKAQTALVGLGQRQQNAFNTITLAGRPIPLGNTLQTVSATAPMYRDAYASSRTGNNDGIREKAALMAQAVNDFATANPDFKWRAEVWGQRLGLIPAAGGDNVIATLATSATDIATDFTRNVRYYSVGTGGTAGLQTPAGAMASDGSAPRLQEYQVAYDVVDQEVDLFNLLILPTDKDHTEATTAGLWGAASVFCQRRRAFLLIDPVASWKDEKQPVAPSTPINVNTLRVGLVKDHSALFYPRLIINEDGRQVQIGASGAIAGLMARTDAARGVWKAPAGTEADIRGIAGLEHKFSDQQNGVLNPKGINTLRVFPVGIVNWGARTMDGDDDFGSEWKYVPVRRLALFIEESLYRGTKWVVFEPNDEPLWAQIRLNIGAFMHNLFRQGAFQGKTPAEAYFVKCDKETTTQTDVNLGIVNILVGFAPLKPAEFVIIKIQQIAGQIPT